MNIALLTESRYSAKEAEKGDWYFGNMLKDDELLIHALAAKNINATRVDWADPAVKWNTFDAAVFRTTWDYYTNAEKFMNWLQEREKEGLRLINKPGIIRWNLDKHYLNDLQKSGIPIVPSVFIGRKDPLALGTVLTNNNWDEAVVKPCISGGAWHTYRFNKSSVISTEKLLQPIAGTHDLLVQPFMEHILAGGEDTLMVFDGTCTHAVRKKAKSGDFRVQDDWGGTVESCEPEPEQIKLAEDAFQAVSKLYSTPCYGRADMVKNAEGQWVIMELELFEPELWIRHFPDSATSFAHAIASRLSV